jgi:RNA polymerase sigma-70 factor (ECF subfamily)
MDGKGKKLRESAIGSSGLRQHVTVVISALFSAQSADAAVSDLRAWSEKQLIAAAKSGRRAPFGELCERHMKKVSCVTRRIMRNREDAEDAAQECFLNAFVHLKDFDGRSSFSTWLTRIAINSALMILRKRRVAAGIAVEDTNGFGMDGLGYQIADRAPDPERCYAVGEEERILKQAIQSLRPALREAVKIQRLEERSMRETAEIMGISVSAAKGRLFHAKVALRKSSTLRLICGARSTDETRALTDACQR